MRKSTKKLLLDETAEPEIPPRPPMDWKPAPDSPESQAQSDAPASDAMTVDELAQILAEVKNAYEHDFNIAKERID